jgi:hypothetical protein
VAEGGGISPTVAIAAVGALAAAAMLLFLAARRRGPGSATPAMVVSMRQRAEVRRVAGMQKRRRSSFGAWVAGMSPVVAYREWRARSKATSDLRRRIKDRQQIKRDTK